MNIFKPYTFNWKQIGVFKLALLAIGAILGAYFADFVKEYIVWFIIVAVLASAYVVAVALRQAK